ncbi:unnamed protein product [Didymodactylos carnosus]|uniref:Uncharacterized protein n=1 Tax=Didymodactylos carnosus TaxID=1234261 RepID=A0A814W5U5_9BILA|nr:unnamed protein product [Didymodactylos carnosus]CAF1197655.1 unnamed protein product [Didymodactylos carnosus]CAF3525804.1 unnamed protein product [Didymodactylos carnosus]CAF3961995.1 unnamed protein product [Didymodactylos carnosus]
MNAYMIYGMMQAPTISLIDCVKEPTSIQWSRLTRTTTQSKFDKATEQKHEDTLQSLLINRNNISTNKFNDSITRGIRWKSEAVAFDIQQSKTNNGKFMFTVEKLMKPSQIRSFFSRLKCLRQTTKDTKPSEPESDIDDEEEAY